MIINFKIILFLILLFKIDQFVYAHGRLIDPAARNTVWRMNFISIPVFDDAELFCGGIKVQHEENAGKCGLCGDAYNAKKKLFETGGELALNFTTKIYTPGSNITTIIDITANHGGIFRFSMCFRDSFHVKETEECFEPLRLIDGSYEYELNSKENALFPVGLTLPTNRTCNACIFRWHWQAGNNWGNCPENLKRTKNDCAVQETWRNCADVMISNEKGIRSHVSFEVKNPEENIKLYYKKKYPQ